MRRKNKKVNRLLSAIALRLKDLPDSTIIELHDIINDKRDGYDYDFKMAVENYRLFTK